MDILTYALAKSYTDKALLGVGTIKGAPCTVKSQTEDDEYVYVTLGWENNLGTHEETVVKIKKGADGAPGEPGPAGDPGPQGVSITKIEKIKTEDLIDTYQISFSDNTTFEYTISNGSTDYLKITNKPSIEGVELIGNKTFEDLNIASADALNATDENLQNLSDLIGDKTSLPAPTDTIVNNITSVDTKVDAIIDDNEAGLAKTFSSDKITKTFATKEEIPTVPSKVSELTNDSNYQTAEQVNSTVTTEIAKIVADAPEDLNTLKEMSDWIAGHENDASAMNSAISDNKTAITALQTGKADKSEIPTTLPANGGNADTVNNHTVKSDVPENAVFTDTVYDDTEVKKNIDELNSNLDGLKYSEVAGGKNLFYGEFVNKVIETGGNYTQRNLKEEFGSINNVNGITYATFGGYFKKGTYTFSYTNDAWFSINRIAIAGTNCIGATQSIRKSYTWTQNVDGWTYFGIEGDDSKTGVTDTPFSVTPDIQIEKGAQATPYEPYIPSVKMLAEENAQQSNSIVDIKMLGWSVPKECPIQNEVNGNQFIQRVGRVDLGSLDWIYETELNRFAALLPGKFKPSNQKEWTRGLYCVLYEANPSPIVDDKVNMTISGYSDDEHLYLHNFSYTDATTFKNAMQGVYLYYELETPITMTIDGNEIITQVKNNLDTLEFGEVAGGKNICKASDNGVVNEITLIKKDVSTIIISGTSDSRAISKNFNVKKGVTYTATFFTSSTNVTGFLWNSIEQVTAYPFGSSKTITFTPTEDKTLSFAVTLTAAISNVEISMQVEEGSKSTSFEPYIPSVKMLAEENTQIDDLNVLGWVVPEEMPIKNYTDSYGVFHQIVGRVDLGTLNWTYDVPNTQFYTDIISQIKQDGDWIYDVYCSKYITASYGDKRIALNRGRIYIGDSSYTDGDSLKHSLRGVYLYFELSTPITMTIDGNEAVTKLKNDLDKLSSLPIGSIIQIEADKDDTEITTQKYGWQYLGTSNIEYESGSANILVTNVYRKNN